MKIADVQDNMKKITINQFYEYLNMWSKGHYNFSYQPIMHNILFLEAFEGLDKLDSIYSKLFEL